MSLMLQSLTGMYVWGRNIGDVLLEWEYWGIFEFVLPFLLVFAVVFGILTKTKLLGAHKGIDMVISLTVGLLAITSYDFRAFFRELFPLAGIGLAILLVILILTGLFHSENDWWKKTFTVIAMIIAGVIILYALTSYRVFGGGAWWWYEYGSAIITGIIIVGLILLVVFAKGKGNTGTPHT